MVERVNPMLPISQQCRLPAVSRSSIHREPGEASAEDLAIMALNPLSLPRSRRMAAWLATPRRSRQSQAGAAPDAASGRAARGRSWISSGDTSRATPVRPNRPTRCNTTKWFIFQCRIAGVRRPRRCAISSRKGRPARPSFVVVSVTVFSVAFKRDGMLATQRVEVAAPSII